MWLFRGAELFSYDFQTILHFADVISQIMSSKALKTSTTSFIRVTERVLPSLHALIKSDDIEVYRETIYDNANGSVNCSSNTHCHIRPSRDTGHDV